MFLKSEKPLGICAAGIAFYDFSFVAVIVFRTIVPRRNLVPRMDAYDCAAGCALVLKYEGT